MKPIILSLVVIVCCAPALAGEAPKWPFALDSTYEQRVAASPRNKVPEADSLVLPHTHFSLRGRYRCEVQGPQGWQLVDGQDLREGAYVRNAEPAPKQ